MTGTPPASRPRLPAPTGLARAALRSQPASFVGTLVALAMASMIISACGFLAETGVRAHPTPHRYASAPVVVTADQRAHLVTGSGEDRTDAAERVPERARLDVARLSRRAEAVPAVARVVPDVRLTVSARHGDTPFAGQGWGSAPLTGTTLERGTAPRSARELALDSAAADDLGARPGDTVTLTTPDGDRAFRLTGTTASARPSATPAAWFTDARARQLAGHPERADALVVRTRSGARPEPTAEALRTALRGTGARVLTGDDRGAAEGSDIAYAQETLTALGFSFGGIAALTAVFTASGAVTLAVAQRRREFALLRAIGATPRRIRRAVATEALCVAPLAGLLGTLPGLGLARWWFGALRDRGALPDGMELLVTGTPVGAAVGTVAVTALLAGHLAARRPSRTAPGLALSEAAHERFRPGLVRTVLGLAALAGGVALARAAGGAGGEEAADLAPAVVLLLMTAVALLGQYVAKCCAWLLGLPLRAAGSAAAGLAAANSWAHARRLASALTPVVLAMAFCSTLVFLQTSEDEQTARQQRAGLTADHLVRPPAAAAEAGAGLPRTAAHRAAALPGVSAAVGVRRAQVLVAVRSDGTSLRTAEAQGVTGTGRALREVQDPGVAAGSLDGLRPGTVAVDRLLADGARAGVGDRLDLRLPDGTRTRPRVIAVYTRGTGLPAVTLPRSALDGHTASAYDSEVLVRTEPGLGPDAAARTARALGRLGDVQDKAARARAADRDRAVNRWGNGVMAAVLAGFAAVAAANTLVMTVAERRRELGMLHRIGATRGQVLRMVRWEALLVAVSGVGLGTALALATLTPMVHGLFGAAPTIPPGLYAAFAGAVVALALLATELPARQALRAHRPRR